MTNRHTWYRSFAFRGSVLPRIHLRVIAFTLLSVALTYLRRRGMLFDVPLIATTIVGSAVGLHIAFRTNSGYERFWEARTAWGAIVNRTRNIARQLHALLDREPRNEGILLTVAFAHAARLHFWKSEPPHDLDRLLGEARSKELQTAPGAAQRTLLELGRLLRKQRLAGQIDSIDQQRVEEDITALIDQFGICQRIASTPLPNAYVIQLRTALAILLIALPLGIAERLGWYTPIAMLVVSYVLIGMEQIGTELEDPFERTCNDVDMASICALIERDLLSLAADEATAPSAALARSASSVLRSQDGS